MAIQEELIKFDDSLALLASRTGIGASYFRYPESLTIEAASRSQYPKLQEAFALNSLFMAVRQEKWRFFTIARRAAAYTLPHFGEISWVEIVEPVSRSPKHSAPTIKSVSFYIDDLSSIHGTLQARNLDPQVVDDGISVRIRGTDKDLIFTDVGIGYAIEEYVQTGSAIQVQL